MTNDPYGPPAGGQQPGQGGSQPPAYGQGSSQPAYGGSQPAYGQGGSQPAYGGSQPAYGQGQYAPGQPQYGGGQPSYGQQPYGQPGYGPGGGFGGRPQLASWGQRVGAYLIDGLVMLPAYLLLVPGFVALAGSIETQTVQDCSSGTCFETYESASGPSAVAILLLLLGMLGMFLLSAWNRWVMGGKGQTIGKKALGISLVGEMSGQPIGTGSAFVRDIAHILDGIPCYLGYLWPLWDDKRQTFSDKIMSTLVIQGPPPGQQR